jgi:hypothetical protein
MSDDPKGVKEIIDAAASHGWVAAFLIGTWGVILRVLIGRAFPMWSEKVLERLTHIEERLADIEARSHNRRREDKHQWEDDPT